MDGDAVTDEQIAAIRERLRIDYDGYSTDDLAFAAAARDARTLFDALEEARAEILALKAPPAGWVHLSEPVERQLLWALRERDEARVENARLREALAFAKPDIRRRFRPKE